MLPIYIGDDRTDEDAFRALRGRPMGGTGILVSSKVCLFASQGLLTFTRIGYTLLGSGGKGYLH